MGTVAVNPLVRSLQSCRWPRGLFEQAAASGLPLRCNRHVSAHCEGVRLWRRLAALDDGQHFCVPLVQKSGPRHAHVSPDGIGQENSTIQLAPINYEVFEVVLDEPHDHRHGKLRELRVVHLEHSC